MPHDDLSWLSEELGPRNGRPKRQHLASLAQVGLILHDIPGEEFLKMVRIRGFDQSDTGESLNIYVEDEKVTRSYKIVFKSTNHTSGGELMTTYHVFPESAWIEF